MSEKTNQAWLAVPLVALGAPHGWRSLVLNPSQAVADLRALVFYRRPRCHM